MVAASVPSIRPKKKLLFYWRNGLLKNRVGRLVNYFFFFFFLPSNMPIYTHIPCVYIHKNMENTD